jgi:hypothetical protein
MKRILATFAAIVAASVLIAAAAASDWVQGPTLLWRYQSDPTFAKDSSTLATCPVQAFFGYTLSNTSTGATQFFQDGSVTFDMVALGEKTVTASKVTVTYAQLAALNGQAAADQFAAQQAAAKAELAKNP